MFLYYLVAYIVVLISRPVLCLMWVSLCELLYIKMSSSPNQVKNVVTLLRYVEMFFGLPKLSEIPYSSPL